MNSNSLIVTLGQSLIWAGLLAYLIHALFHYLEHRLDVLGTDLLTRRCESCGEPVTPSKTPHPRAGAV